MRLATTVSVALIALSTAALAQVADPANLQFGNNALDNAAAPATPTPTPEPNDHLDPTHNMLSDSASPPPTEPK
jgi:hypothetical protein